MDTHTLASWSSTLAAGSTGQTCCLNLTAVEQTRTVAPPAWPGHRLCPPAVETVGAARWPNLGRHQPCPSGPSTAPQRAFGFSPTPSGQSSGPQSGASAGAGASLQVSFGARRKPTPAGGAARCSVAVRERAIHQRQLACGNVSLLPRDAHRPPSSAGLRMRRSSGGLSKFASGSANVAAGG